jgi:hypothetical protein
MGQTAVIGFSPHYMYQLPFGDIEKKFTANSNVGGSIHLKLKNNWTFGIEGQYIFASNYKDLSLIGSATTDGGFVIGKDLGSGYDGYTIETPAIEGRGANFFVEFGKLFPLMKHNRDCGLHLKAGLGTIYYKATITIDDLLAKQISDNYSAGYNRQESGISYNFYTGYTFYGESRFLNGSIGIQYTYFNSSYSNTYDYAYNRSLQGFSFSNFLIGPKASMTIILKSFDKKDDSKDGYYYN